MEPLIQMGCGLLACLHASLPKALHNHQYGLQLRGSPRSHSLQYADWH